MFTFVIWVILFQAVYSLKLVELNVPAGVALGSPVWMYCGYDLEGDDLYSVKWYKDHVEFYRFLPSDQPPGQKYDLHGVNIDLERSNHTHVFLTETSLSTEGLYECEVSTEAPSYSTVQVDKTLKIYALPQEPPDIEGNQPTYQIGEVVNVTCQSKSSKPASNLTWYVNGKKAKPLYITAYPIQKQQNGLETTALGLTFIVTYSHFSYGAMRLRCTASVIQEYSTHSKELIVGENIKADNFYSSNVVVQDIAPRVTGDRGKYVVGDIVDLNCSSSRFTKSLRLSWTINGKPANISYLVRYPDVHQENGITFCRLGLRFIVTQKHLHGDGLKIRCTATVAKVIDTNEKEVFIGGFQQTSGLHVVGNLEADLAKGRVDAFIPSWIFILGLPTFMLQIQSSA
ncbi:CD166 antigen-like [Tachypleus tridentatus]|uniref:CD166 antigen-like n=1 Tax=Tachypleus tridentatus TaxID=6853 RepID=UPI003FD69647